MVVHVIKCPQVSPIAASADKSPAGIFDVYVLDFRVPEGLP